MGSISFSFRLLARSSGGTTSLDLWLGWFVGIFRVVGGVVLWTRLDRVE